MQKKIIVIGKLFICSLLLNLTSCFKNDRYVAPLPTTNLCNGQPGPLFIAVRGVITNNCIICHNNSNLNGNMNWTIDCNIVTNRARIKARAVDEKTMPPTGPLSQADRDKITDWLNAGGAITN